MAENWYAAKIYSAKPNIMKYLTAKHIETFVPMVDDKPLIASLIFLRCTQEDLAKTKADWYRQIVIYRSADRERPEPIPDAEMDNFKMVLSIKNLEFHPLEVSDKTFFAGQKVKVLDGPLKGAVGVIKRIKGDRRLVVSVTGVAAIATSYIRPELLEEVGE